NILLDNRNRTWDLITGITPAINLIWESRTHRLIAGYNFTAELYLRDPTRDNAFNTQNFNLDGMWRASERLTLTLADAYTATTDTPKIGASWQVTPTITLAVNGGPTFELHDNGDSRITPTVTATYEQTVKFGTVGLGFDRQVATAGGLGGVTDNTSVFGHVDVITFTRGLTLSFAPRYSWVKSDGKIRRAVIRYIDITSLPL